MHKFPSALPNDETLTRVLSSCLSNRSDLTTLTVTERKWNPYESAAPSEIVTCRLSSGDTLQLFCKYAAGSEHVVDHRGGTEREAQVYRHVIGPLGLRPRFFGSHFDPDSGETWLFVEYLGDQLRMFMGPQPESMQRSARWIGKFHRTNEGRLRNKELGFLPRYDSDYYVSWANKTLQFCREDLSKLTWLPDVCRYGSELLAMLPERPQTIIHAEYYPKNILLMDTDVCPIDWESAAIGAGEIDLASLTQQWSPELVIEGERNYQSARWSDSDSSGFREALIAARLYWAFKWIVITPECGDDANAQPWLDELHALGQTENIIA